MRSPKIHDAKKTHLALGKHLQVEEQSPIRGIHRAPETGCKKNMEKPRPTLKNWRWPETSYVRMLARCAQVLRLKNPLGLIFAAVWTGGMSTPRCDGFMLFLFLFFSRFLPPSLLSSLPPALLCLPSRVFSHVWCFFSVYS